MCPEHTQHSASEHSASVPMAQMTAQNTSLQFNPSLRERLWHATSFHETKPEKKIRPPEQWANTRTDERDKGNDKWNHTSILTFGKKIWGRQMKYTKGKTVTAATPVLLSLADHPGQRAPPPPHRLPRPMYWMIPICHLPRPSSSQCPS